MNYHIWVSIPHYRRFIKNFAHIAAPLNRLTAKVDFIWTEEQEKAFKALKFALTSAPVIKKPEFDKDWILETDASDMAIGAVLSQEVGGETHPVYYWSR